MKQWNYWPYITLGFLGIAFMMTGLTIFIAITKAPVEMDQRFQMSYQDANEKYLDFQNDRDAFTNAGYKIQVQMPTVLKGGHFNFTLKGGEREVGPKEVSLVITRPATNEEQIGPNALSPSPEGFAAVVDLPKGGCWIFDLKFTVKDWTLFERNSLYFSEEGVLQENRSCGRK
ncbi:MAG: FixH family protein [SAR324 cluster bacterium]|nr:FixH family protein [SAR324 cluster bacterium]